MPESAKEFGISTKYSLSIFSASEPKNLLGMGRTASLLIPTASWTLTELNNYLSSQICEPVQYESSAL